MKELLGFATIALGALIMWRKSLLGAFGYEVSWVRHIRDWKNFARAIAEENEPETKRQYRFLQTSINILMLLWFALLAGMIAIGP